MNNPRLVFIIACLAAPAFAQTLAETTAATAEPAIEHAYYLANDSNLGAELKSLDAALASDPKNPALLYERAFAHYAATAALRASKDDDAIEAELNRAMALLERVQGQPWQAEAEALHSSLLGELIGIKGGMSGMTLGPKSGQLIGRAVKTLPKSPRVLLFRGISLLNTPKMFGGDPVQATKLLQQAVEGFAADDIKAAGPHWGHADALTWLGIAKQKEGDLTSARALWQQSLEIEPDYGWVKFALLPSLAQKPRQ